MTSDSHGVSHVSFRMRKTELSERLARTKIETHLFDSTPEPLRCLIIRRSSMYKAFLLYGLFPFFIISFLPSNTSSQLEGRLFMDKDEYVRGEPVFLHFELTNTGTTPMTVATGNSYSYCGGYHIEVSNKPVPESSTCGPLGIAFGC